MNTQARKPIRQGHDGFRVFLIRELETRRQAESAYSLRQFARDLGEDPSALAKLLHGKVEIGPRAIEKLGKALLLDFDDLEEFKEESRARRRARRGTELPDAPRAASEYRPVQADVFRVVSDWYHFAILELMQLKNFEPEPSKIAKQLGVSVTDVSLALERLVRVGMIERCPNGALVDRTGGFSTNVAQPFFDPAHRRMQKQILEKAIRALETVPVARRDQSAVTLAFDSRRIQEAKLWIREFRRKFNAEFGEGEERDSVYHFSLSLYPVTEPQTKRRKSRREK